MLVVAKRIIKQITHDRRSMAVIIIAPLMLITLIYFLLGKSDYKPAVALDKQTAATVLGSTLEQSFEKSFADNKDIVFSVLPDGSDPKEYVKDKNADAVITFVGQDISIVMFEQSNKMGAVTDALKTASNALSLSGKAETEYVGKIAGPGIPVIPGITPANYVPKIAIAPGTAPGAFENALKNNADIEYVSLPDNIDAKSFVNSGNADAVITFSGDKIGITMLKQDMVITSKVSAAVGDASSAIKIGKNSDVDLVFGSKDQSMFDSLAYFLIGFLSFFFIFIFAGISFVRERTMGTLERLMRTPIRSGAIVAGYSVGFGFFAVVQSVLFILFVKFVLNTPFVGEWWLAMVIMLMIAIIAVMMGIFVSVVSKTEFQVMQAIPVLIVPQAFFSGLIPVDMLPYHLDVISYIMPLYYSGMALKNVMVYGYGFEAVWPYMAVLAGIMLILFFANVMVVRKSRRS